jgi:VCBS repeat-containing protein
MTSTAQAIPTIADLCRQRCIPNADSFTVTRTGGSTGTQTFPITDASANSYVDTGLDAHTTYTYTVKATNVTGTSPTSASASADTLNTPPTAADRAEVVLHDTTLDIPAADLAGADADPADTASLDQSSPSTPKHGTLTIDTDGTVHYKPTAKYIGKDSFTYTTTDGHDHSHKGTVDIDVTDIPPRAHSQVYFANAGQEIDGTLAAADGDNVTLHPPATFRSGRGGRVPVSSHVRNAAAMVFVGSNPRSFSVRKMLISTACVAAPCPLRLQRLFLRMITAGRMFRSPWLLSGGTPGVSRNVNN